MVDYAGQSEGGAELMGVFPDFTKIALPRTNEITATFGEMPGAHVNAEQLLLPALGCADPET